MSFFRLSRRHFLGTTLVFGALFLTPAHLTAQVTTRVSVDSSGAEADRFSAEPSMSADGRYVSFTSDATNLVPGDTNNEWDVFVHDRRTGSTERISVDSAGNEGDLESYGATISGDGQVVAFTSVATNLVAGDTNGQVDVFVHDRITNVTTRISVDSAGNQSDDISWVPRISPDGRRVAFMSRATNLVSGDTNGATDVFVHDLLLGTTVRVSVASSGLEGNGDSEFPRLTDNSLVVFWSTATNLVSGDTNGEGDVFVHNMTSGVTTRVSVSSKGFEGNDLSRYPDISADGSTVVFESWATNLVLGDTNDLPDLFARDLVTGTTWRVSVSSRGRQANGASDMACVDGTGSRIAFRSNASNLVPGDTSPLWDIFSHDRATGATTRVNVSTGGDEADGASAKPALSRDARLVSFNSEATNLVPGDLNGRSDIFVHGPELILEATPDTVNLGDFFELATWTGASGFPAMLYVVDVDGNPFVFRIATGKFDGAGHWVKRYQMPNNPIYRGLDITFLSFGFGVSKDLGVSGPEVLSVR